MFIKQSIPLFLKESRDLRRFQTPELPLDSLNCAVTVLIAQVTNGTSWPIPSLNGKLATSAETHQKMSASSDFGIDSSASDQVCAIIAALL
jgi:hypothetical protein